MVRCILATLLRQGYDARCDRHQARGSTVDDSCSRSRYLKKSHPPRSYMYISYLQFSYNAGTFWQRTSSHFCFLVDPPPPPPPPGPPVPQPLLTLEQLEQQKQPIRVQKYKRHSYSRSVSKPVLTPLPLPLVYINYDLNIPFQRCFEEIVHFLHKLLCGLANVLAGITCYKVKCVAETTIIVTSSPPEKLLMIAIWSPTPVEQSELIRPPRIVTT